MGPRQPLPGDPARLDPAGRGAGGGARSRGRARADYPRIRDHAALQRLQAHVDAIDRLVDEMLRGMRTGGAGHLERQIVLRTVADLNRSRRRVIVMAGVQPR